MQTWKETGVNGTGMKGRVQRHGNDVERAEN